MTTKERNASRVRGEALVRALELSRAGSVIGYIQAAELYCELVGKTHSPTNASTVLSIGRQVYTSGGAVVCIVPAGIGGYRVQVSASPI